MSKDLFPGLPDDLLNEFVEENKQVNTSSSLSIKVEKRKYGKLWAVILGIEKNRQKDLLKILKTKMSCGGTIKNNCLEILFGKIDKTKDLVKILEAEGFDNENINILK